MNIKWDYKKIGDVCIVERGGSPRPIENFITDSSDGINWIKIGDTDDSMYITKTAQKIRPEGMKKSRYVQPGDFLLSNSMSFGRPYILKIDGCIHDGWLVLRDKENLFDKRFLYYYLSAETTYMKFKGMAVGGVVNNLNSEMVRKVTVPVPTKTEQSVIADRLDTVNTIISFRQQQLAKLDELVKARFVEMFGDPIVNPNGYCIMTLQEMIDMGDIIYHSDGNHGGDYPRSDEFVEAGVPYISANCIVNGEIDFSKAKYLTEKRAGKLRKGIACDSDVLFAHNATVGPTVILHTTEEKVILGTSLTAYRCNTRSLLPEYLKSFMLSDAFVKQYSEEMKQTTRNQVPITQQKKYLFLKPPVFEQQRFADCIKQTDKIKLSIQKSLEQMETLKKSLMQQYFG